MNKLCHYHVVMIYVMSMQFNRVPAVTHTVYVRTLIYMAVYYIIYYIVLCIYKCIYCMCIIM